MLLEDSGIVEVEEDSLVEMVEEVVADEEVAAPVALEESQESSSAVELDEAALVAEAAPLELQDMENEMRTTTRLVMMFLAIIDWVTSMR